MKILIQKKHQDHVPCSFADKVVFVDDRFTRPIVVYRGENAAYEFINKAIIKQYKYCRKVMNKHFNKNLIMGEEREHFFQQTVVRFVKNLLITMREK